MRRNNVNTSDGIALQHAISTIDKLKGTISNQGEDNDMTILLNLKKKYFTHKLKLLLHGR